MRCEHRRGSYIELSAAFIVYVVHDFSPDERPSVRISMLIVLYLEATSVGMTNELVNKNVVVYLKSAFSQN